MRSLITRFNHDESGSILILTALLMAMFIALGGAAYDLGREQLIKDHTQQAMDAAAISGGMTDQDNALNGANIFYSVNFPETFMGQSPNDTGASINFDGQNINLSATLTIQDSYSRVMGTNSHQYTVASSSPLAVVNYPADVILVADNTDSLTQIFISTKGDDACKDQGSIKCQCDLPPPSTIQYGFGIMCGDATTMQKNCNKVLDIGNIHCSDSKFTNPKNVISREATGVYSRLNALRYNANYLAQILLIDNDLTDPSNPNNNQLAIIGFSDIPKSGGKPTDGLVMNLPFTQKLTDAQTAISGMFTNIGTNSTLGMKQAQTISQKSDGFRSKAKHVVIFLTDGQNSASAEDGHTIDICNAFKSQNPPTIVFSILLGDQTGLSTAEKTAIIKFLTDCATPGNFYQATDSAALADAFKQIIQTIHNVRLTQ